MQLKLSLVTAALFTLTVAIPARRPHAPVPDPAPAPVPAPGPGLPGLPNLPNLPDFTGLLPRKAQAPAPAPAPASAPAPAPAPALPDFTLPALPALPKLPIPALPAAPRLPTISVRQKAPAPAPAPAPGLDELNELLDTLDLAGLLRRKAPAPAKVPSPAPAPAPAPGIPGLSSIPGLPGITEVLPEIPAIPGISGLARRAAPAPATPAAPSGPIPALPALPVLPALPTIPKGVLPTLPKISLRQATDTFTCSPGTTLLCCANSIVTPIGDAGEGCGTLSSPADACDAPSEALCCEFVGASSGAAKAQCLDVLVCLMSWSWIYGDTNCGITRRDVLQRRMLSCNMSEPLISSIEPERVEVET
ncbi:hypothetical protein BDP27DRAFT_1369917 [Rhodocollybia butyracea]|uniref:Uncharacterized protein n=1 Tax=Rhodocollybia butyracea TaxID=206335 RepID=A0A9P5PFI8_9AGAR|nr:hypothetical protein BDP27DRAFT_1369917 [Rhodocollybia butyracea]